MLISQIVFYWSDVYGQRFQYRCPVCSVISSKITANMKMFFFFVKTIQKYVLKLHLITEKNASSMKISIIYTDSKKEAITTSGEFFESPGHFCSQ